MSRPLAFLSLALLFSCGGPALDQSGVWELDVDAMSRAMNPDGMQSMSAAEQEHVLEQMRGQILKTALDLMADGTCRISLPDAGHRTSVSGRRVFDERIELRGQAAASDQEQVLTGRFLNGQRRMTVQTPGSGQPIQMIYRRL